MRGRGAPRIQVREVQNETRSLGKAGAWLVLGIAAAVAALLTPPTDARIIAWFAAAACFGFALLQFLENARWVGIVYEGYVGVLYRKGKLTSTLPPGKHTVWGLDTYVNTLMTRSNPWLIPSQEILTSDSIPVRVSLACVSRIDDPMAYSRHGEPNTLYYTDAQIALRDAIAKRTAASILIERAAISQEVFEAVREKSRAYGVELESLQIRDITFTGEFRSLMAKLTRSKIEGQALLERTRAETAALRNLANAAKMVEENPMLLQLRALQAAEGGTNATLVIGKDAKPANP